MALIPLAEPPLINNTALHVAQPVWARVSSVWCAHLNHLAGAQLINVVNHIVEAPDTAGGRGIAPTGQTQQFRFYTSGTCNYLWVALGYYASNTFDAVNVPDVDISIVGIDTGFTWNRAAGNLPMPDADFITRWGNSFGDARPLFVFSQWSRIGQPDLPRLLEVTSLTEIQVELVAAYARICQVTVIQAYVDEL